MHVGLRTPDQSQDRSPGQNVVACAASRSKKRKGWSASYRLLKYLIHVTDNYSVVSHPAKSTLLCGHAYVSDITHSTAHR